MKTKVNFIDETVKQAFVSLKDSDDAGRKLREWIIRAKEDLENDAYCGIRIKKELIPQEYINKYGVRNLWKYDLPKGWRLM